MRFAREEPVEKEDDTHVTFDVASRRIGFLCKIDRRAVQAFDTIIHIFKKAKNPESIISVLVDTDGGLAFQGLAIYDLMQACGLKFRTVLLGEIASSGLAVALGGHQRWMHRHAALHFHATAIQFGKPREVLEQFEENVQRAQKKFIDDMYKEIVLTNSKLKAGQLRELELKEICMTPEEALEVGLIHKII